MKEQLDEMWRELDVLIKMNRALSKENEGLWARTATPVTPFHNVIPIGLTDATLSRPYVTEAKVVVAKQMDKRKLVERLSRANNNDSHDVDNWDQCKPRPTAKKQLFSHNPSSQVLSDIASSPFMQIILSQKPPSGFSMLKFQKRPI